jgi:hypothetical protein
MFFEKTQQMQIARVALSTQSVNERKGRVVIDRQYPVVSSQQVRPVRTSVGILDKFIVYRLCRYQSAWVRSVR